MLKQLVGSVVLAVATSGIALAADDPSMHDVYQAANSGHVAQAQAMIGKVLADHPNSAKAHYVAAELDAKQGEIAGAREQLQTAERLAPGLSFATPEAVQALRSALGVNARGASPSAYGRSGPAQHSGISFGLLLALLLGAGFFVYLLLRRRSPVPTPAYPAAYPPSGGAFGAPSGIPPQGGGIGSTIASGLAGGLAAGAGIVAGEALMHRIMGGDDDRAGRARSMDDVADRPDPRGNADMGGTDFGVSDSSSWDDSTSLGGSGSDDWG
ncbi:MAG: hypothetical protein NVS9B10_02080 [Nevskia sp.]